jgi:hypothetical protein
VLARFCCVEGVAAPAPGAAREPTVGAPPAPDDRPAATRRAARAPVSAGLFSSLFSLPPLSYCTHTMGCTDPAPEPNQLAFRLCTFGPTKRYSCTQILGKARFWADLGGFCEVSCPENVSWVRCRVTHVLRPLRYRYQAIHLTVCVQYTPKRKVQGCSAERISRSAEQLKILALRRSRIFDCSAEQRLFARPSCSGLRSITEAPTEQACSARQFHKSRPKIWLSW